MVFSWALSMDTNDFNLHYNCKYMYHISQYHCIILMVFHKLKRNFTDSMSWLDGNYTGPGGFSAPSR